MLESFDVLLQSFVEGLELVDLLLQVGILLVQLAVLGDDNFLLCQDLLSQEDDLLALLQVVLLLVLLVPPFILLGLELPGQLLLTDRQQLSLLEVDELLEGLRLLIQPLQLELHLLELVHEFALIILHLPVALAQFCHL